MDSGSSEAVACSGCRGHAAHHESHCPLEIVTSVSRSALSGTDSPYATPFEHDPSGRAVRRLEEPIRVLLVEDNEGDFRLTREMIADACTEAISAEMQFVLFWVSRLSCAHELLRRNAIDCILLDLSLPDASSLEACQSLVQSVPQVPIILLTGSDDIDTAKQALGKGAQDYLVKGRVDGGLLARSIVYGIQRKRAEVERLKLEARIINSEKLESLGVMAGGLAHDLNNLLQGILSHTNIALNITKADDRLQLRLGQIEKLVGHAAELVDNLFACSGQVRFGGGAIDLTELARETVDLIREKTPSATILAEEYDEELPQLSIDASQIRQVVANLIHNAVEALPRGAGSITVRTRLERVAVGKSPEIVFGEPLIPGAYIALEVEDTGVGMDRSTSQRIFEPFFTTKRSGRGLGLASVLGIVKGNRGAIRVRSQKGQGTQFTVLFPINPNVMN